jgi:O-methyltransferase involved in polyketide biosynthesis
VTKAVHESNQSSGDSKKSTDLTVTALYTSQAWVWGGFSEAELLASKEARGVFRFTNGALAFARLFMWRLKSLKHSLVHRHAMIDHLAHQAGAPQVIELASGLSRRGAAMSADPAVRYVEVDLPHVLEKKAALLQRTDRGRAVSERQNLQFEAHDVADLDLSTLVDPAIQTTVLSEGLLMYLDADAQRDLWRRIAAITSQHAKSIYLFDLVPACEQPRPGFVGRALRWLMERFTGGKSFERDERTREDIVHDLTEAGFARVEVIEPRNVAEQWGLPFPTIKTQQVLFVCASKQATPTSPPMGE